jgi:hypothetical protein
VPRVPRILRAVAALYPFRRGAAEAIIPAPEGRPIPAWAAPRRAEPGETVARLVKVAQLARRSAAKAEEAEQRQR